MALPPIEVDEELEAEEESLEAELPAEEPVEEMPDAMFAADVAEAFPDLDDAQIMALQRAVFGLISMGGAPPGGSAPPAPMEF